MVIGNSDRLGRKRTLADITGMIIVGDAMLSYTIKQTRAMYELGQDISPIINKYAGTICSGLVEYVLPAVTGISFVALGALVVMATDKYMSNSEER